MDPVQIIFFLKEYFKQVFGEHYPIPVVNLITQMTYTPLRIKIACGVSHTCLLIADRTYGWGSNKNNQLGCTKYPIRTIPFRFTLSKTKTIKCGYHNTLLLSSKNKIFVWGGNI